MRALTFMTVVTALGLGVVGACGSSSETKPSNPDDAGAAGEGATSSGGSSTGGRAGEGGAPSGGSTSTGGRAGSSTGGSATGGAPGGAGAGPGGEGGEAAEGGEGGSQAGASGEGGAGGDVQGRALHFDGTDDLLSLPADAGAANETAYSIELWFRTSTPTGMLFEVYGSGADRSLYVSAGNVCFYVYEPAYNEICTTTATYADGSWHHAAGTLGSGGQHLYVDGVPGPSTTVTASAFVADTGFRAGYGHIGPNGPLTYFAGDIDEIRLWSVERSATQIAQNRSQSIDPMTSGLQGYWKLDGTGSDSTASDSTAGNHAGTLTNFSFAPTPWISQGAF